MMEEHAKLDKRAFRKLADLIYDHVGIVLTEKKEALVSARVGKRMRAIGINDYQAYYEFVKNDRSGEEIVELLNAISTNVTHFFREPRHFEILGSIMKKWEAEGQRKFRIWCAASSTGEEPYTIAMTVKDALDDCSNTRILATDISTKVLGIAKQGIYKKTQLEKVPKRMVNDYFDKVKNGEFRIRDTMRHILKFGRLNLMDHPYPLHGPLDVIFCRNVMIYFDNKGRKGFLDDAYRLLKPGGYLMVGHSESMSGIVNEFKTVEPAVYVKQ